MLNMILELTKGEISGNYENFLNANYWDGFGILQDFWIMNQDFDVKEITFYDNGEELLIYTNLGKYACNYKIYCDVKFITNVYNKDELVFKHDFDYESPTSLCLMDLYDLKNACPDMWMYQLNNIYKKHGLDTVNFVIYCAGYNRV